MTIAFKCQVVGVSLHVVFCQPVNVVIEFFVVMNVASAPQLTRPAEIVGCRYIRLLLIDAQPK